MNEIKHGLIQMGYREHATDFWCKPVANHVFVFHMSDPTFGMTWGNYYMSSPKVPDIWKDQMYSYKEEVDIIEFLKLMEQHAFISSKNESDFEFITTDDLFEFM